MLGLSLATFGPARVCAEEPTERDGIHVRGSVGATALSLNRQTTREGSPGSWVFRGDSSSVRGPAVAADLSLGGSVAPGMVVGATLLGQVLPSARLELNSGESFKLSSPLRFWALGPMVDVYPSADDGFHFGGTLGVARAIAETSDPAFPKLGGHGAALTLAIGYEWRLAGRSALGLLGRGTVAFVAMDQETATSSATERDWLVSIGAAVTYAYY